MKILALDASTLTGSVAVVDDGAVLAETSARVRATHSEQLLPLVHECLSRAGATLADVTRLAVGIGPGSFTGVRLGVATAKGLHLATGIPLVGVRSLDALAASAWGARGLVLAALDARRGEVFAALYDARGGARDVVLDGLNGTPEAVGEQVRARCGEAEVLVVGDLSRELVQRLAGVAHARFSLAPPVLATPLARFVAWEAERGAARSDLGDMEPAYFRGSDAKLPAARAT